MGGYKINPVSNFDEKMRTTQFFTLYFSGFKYIFLSNLLFIVPSLIAVLYIYGLYKLIGGFYIIAAASVVIILNPFVAGLTLVSRYIYTEKEFSVKESFFRGVKENWKQFLVHGVVEYLLFLVSYFSIVMYYNGTKTSAIFWLPFALTVLITVVVLFSSYYLSIMTVTMDIKLKDIYRNCLLFSFGEIKNNLLATMALTILLAVVATVFIAFFNPLAIIIVSAVLQMFFLPSTIQYIITFYVYDSMLAILDKSVKNESEQEEKHIEQPKINKEDAEELSQILNSSKDEYIFHNGKMIKRSLVEGKLNEFDDDF